MTVVGTDAQHAGGITDATAIEGHIDDVAADLRYSAPILILEEKDPPLALPIVTPIALGAIGLLTRLDDLCAVTVRTLHRDRDPRLPPGTLIMRGQRT
jgi:hypothetical protein